VVGLWYCEVWEGFDRAFGCVYGHWVVDGQPEGVLCSVIRCSKGWIGLRLESGGSQVMGDGNVEVEMSLFPTCFCEKSYLYFRLLHRCWKREQSRHRQGLIGKDLIIIKKYCLKL
jgi:hypothetical protein